MFFYCNYFDYILQLSIALCALLKEEVILNKSLLFWGNKLAAIWLLFHFNLINLGLEEIYKIKERVVLVMPKL